MQCKSCGAPLEAAKCLYCGRTSAEFSQMEKDQPQHISAERTEPIAAPIEAAPLVKTTAMPFENYIEHSEVKKQAITKFLLCLFLGLLGAHYFYEKKFVFGILYLLTRGLFWAGWIFDCIRLFINMIKVL